MGSDVRAVLGSNPALQEICKLVLGSGLAVMREGSIAARQLLHDLDLGDDVEAKVLDADVRGDHANQMYVDAMSITVKTTFVASAPGLTNSACDDN